MAMYIHKVLYIAFVLFYLVDDGALASSSVDFIRDFAVENHRASVILHVPNDLLTTNALVKWYVK